MASPRSPRSPRSVSSRRHDAPSSPPPTLTIQKGRSTDSLDAILLKQTSHRSPEECFGFARPFMTDPKYEMLPTFRPIRGPTTRLRQVRNWTSKMASLEMTKSASMPEFYLDDPMAEAQPVIERNVWKCQLCGTNEPSHLERNPADGSMSCKCGAGAGIVDMVSLERSKNCHRDLDPTDVADAPPQAASQPTAWHDSTMSREDRRRQEKAQLGGTHVSNACARKNDMQQALSVVERQARKDAAETIRPDGTDNNRGRKLMDAFVLAFGRMTALPGGDQDDVQRYIRTEAIRIYQLSRRHDDVCGAKGCIYTLQNKHLTVLTVSIIELVLSQLAGDEPGDGRSVEEISQGNVSKMDIRRAIEQLHQYQEECRVSYGHRLEVLSSLSRISKWNKPNQEKFKCEPLGHGLGGSFTTAARLSCPNEFGKSALPDPSDNSGKLLNELIAIARVNPMDTETREAVGYQARRPELLEYLSQDHGFRREVLAIAVVAATAKKMNKEDVTGDLRRLDLFRNQNISRSTIDAFIEQLMPHIELPHPLDGEPAKSTKSSSGKEEDQLWGKEDAAPGTALAAVRVR